MASNRLTVSCDVRGVAFQSRHTPTRSKANENKSNCGSASMGTGDRFDEFNTVTVNSPINKTGNIEGSILRGSPKTRTVNVPAGSAVSSGQRSPIELGPV